MLTNFRRIRLLGTVAIAVAAAGCDKTPTAPVSPVEPPAPIPAAPQRDMVPFIWTPGEGMREIPLPADALKGDATAINNSGEVVGWYSSSNGNQEAFVWSAQRGFRNIRVFINSRGNVALHPIAINDHGQVLFDGGYSLPFVWQDGNADFLPESSTEFVAHGINNSGQVSGEEIVQLPVPGFEPGIDPNFAEGPAVHYNYVSRPFVWTRENGVRYLLSSTTVARTVAMAINDNGLVVGYAGAAASNLVQNSNPVIWGAADDLPANLSTRVDDSGCTPGWDPTTVPDNACAGLATAVNNAGEIAGTIDRHAFRWTETQRMNMLPGSDAESYATGINSSGDVVGFIYNPVQVDGFVWRKSGAVEKIGSLPGRWWSFANAVNDRGQVVGNAH